ncbi:succinate dehydrogenase iron-sulfur subunit [Longimicrobium terrae]|uniref:Succinate dehydrogenase iron-sulfur subunit n=1 Tax=Longimicrobium terrae TaxID=1639882 RepID=A0A841GKQ6_9BACT|nr:succinate dehydrogenase iron-sulfur subunit [Longimicrobium terrae]MBB4634782.1 succinate dehydrogenase / fumarate reductase iron-sulfur subunit [Longimicrobium terrae]MBB6069177.1 succinate dehydrogenase / fumarate reductase iron-sulfur subunit [Longimicrobium terrae]NNC32007.1 succinate dehydrogenase iron-sulfur subunit [Longimicrobium terrae]
MAAPTQSRPGVAGGAASVRAAAKAGAHSRITLRIFRFNPDTDEKPVYREYTVDADPTDRVLDALNQVKWYEDGTLTYRRSCAHGICGSDAMRINGVNRLACKVLIRDVGNSVTIEPLMGFRVIKDMVVDMEPFFAQYRSVMPFLINDSPVPTDGRERRQTVSDREKFDDTTKCILCAACTTSCPSFWADDNFVGPAAIVNAHRFIFDSRDGSGDERLEILNDREGVWRCRTIFNCTEACPREIRITKAIGEVKQAILKGGAHNVTVRQPASAHAAG